MSFPASIRKERKMGKIYLEVHTMASEKNILPNLFDGRPSRAFDELEKEQFDQYIEQTKDAIINHKITILGVYYPVDDDDGDIKTGFFVGHDGKWFCHESDGGTLNIKESDDLDMVKALQYVSEQLSEDRKFKKPDWVEDFKSAIHDGDMDKIKDLVEVKGYPLIFTPDTQTIEDSYFLDNVLLRKKQALERELIEGQESDALSEAMKQAGMGGAPDNEREKIIRDLKTYKGWSSLEECVVGPHPAIACYLLSKADLDQQVEVEKELEVGVEVSASQCAMTIAGTEPDHEVVKMSDFLLAHALNRPGPSTYEAVKFLLTSGADPNPVFKIACRNGNRNLIAVFLESDNFNIMDHEDAVREAAIHAEFEALDLIRLYDVPEEWLNVDPF